MILIFSIGLSVMLYPTVSDYINSLHQSHAIADYSTALKDYTATDITEKLTAANEYNAELRNTPMAFYNPKLIDGYENLLNMNGTGIMGYISIDQINVKLPIYHTVDESVLQVAVGHLEGTSLPVGGAGTHCVLSGHRGLPSAQLFSNLDKLEIGDTFVITVFEQKLTYQIDQIKTVLPTDVEDLQIVDGKDYCTLMTCTPYGINSHRLLVRGTRIENEIEMPENDAKDTATSRINSFPFIAVPVIIFPILLILLVKRRRERAKENDKKNI